MQGRFGGQREGHLSKELKPTSRHRDEQNICREQTLK